jgi:hypothetical protein
MHLLKECLRIRANARVSPAPAAHDQAACRASSPASPQRNDSPVSFSPKETIEVVR